MSFSVSSYAGNSPNEIFGFENNPSDSRKIESTMREKCPRPNDLAETWF